MNHTERVNCIEEQISLGKTNDQIIAMIKKEQWKDFNEVVSRRQIDAIRISKDLEHEPDCD